MRQAERAKEMIGAMAIPAGSLGSLGTMAERFLAVSRGKELKPVHLIFAADNGVVKEGVVKQPQKITYLMAKNMVAGRSAVACFCRCNGIPWRVVDVGIRHREAVGIDRKVALGTLDFLEGPAMTAEECSQAYGAGAEMARQAAAEGFSLISLGEMGIGNTTTSSALLHGLSGLDPALLVGCGANPGMPEIILRKRQVVAEGVQKHKPFMRSPLDILRCVGGFDLAALCGAMVECAALGIPFMLDGFITAAALACAVAISPSVRDMALLSHISREPGMPHALRLAGLDPELAPLQAGLALGEGTGAVLGVTLLRTMLYTVSHIERMDKLLAAARPGEGERDEIWEAGSMA